MNNPKVSFPVSVPIGSSRSGVSLGAGGKESRVCSVLSPITEPPLLLTRLRERGRRKNCFVATCSFYNCCKNVLATKHRCKAHVLHPCGFLSCGTRSLGPTQPAQGVLELVLSLSLLPPLAAALCSPLEPNQGRAAGSWSGHRLALISPIATRGFSPQPRYSSE